MIWILCRSHSLCELRDRSQREINCCFIVLDTCTYSANAVHQVLSKVTDYNNEMLDAQYSIEKDVE